MAGNRRWKSLSSRIVGFVEAVAMWGAFNNALANGSQGKQLYQIGQEILRQLELYIAENSMLVPPGILNSSVGSRLRALLEHPIKNMGTPDGAVGEAAILFHSVVTEIEYFLADDEMVLRRLSERALMHLRWTIVADQEIRAKWQAAFADGEVASERLGAAHMLWHGIYPFKVTQRVATDLILTEPVQPDQVSLAQGAVLTEWKVFRGNRNLADVITEAEFQTREYSSGILGATELQAVRYIIIVSETELHLPSDTVMNGHVYRHINIPVNPGTPSLAGPRLRREAKQAG